MAPPKLGLAESRTLSINTTFVKGSTLKVQQATKFRRQRSNCDHNKRAIAEGIWKIRDAIFLL